MPPLEHANPLAAPRQIRRRHQAIVAATDDDTVEAFIHGRGDCRRRADWTKGWRQATTGRMSDPPIINPYEPPQIADAGPAEVSCTEQSHPEDLLKSRLLVLAAATMWSTSGFFVKAPQLAGWPGPTLAFWRAAFACVVLWPLVRRPQWSWKLVPMAAIFAAMNYTYLTAMAKGSAANAIWLQCTAPVWVLLVGVFLFREKTVWRDWLLVGFAAAGVAVILHYESRGESFEAVLWGLASGLFYAGVVLSLRQLRSMESVWLVAVNHLATAIM